MSAASENRAGRETEIVLVQLLDDYYRKSYYFVEATPLKAQRLKARLSAKEGEIALSDYGTVLKSGWGSVPEKWLKKYNISL